jgi:hypothetical protein
MLKPIPRAAGSASDASSETLAIMYKNDNGITLLCHAHLITIPFIIPFAEIIM